MLHTLEIENAGPLPVGSIYCIGRNYSEHAKELGHEAPIEEPVVFLKAASSIRSLHGGPLGFQGVGLHYEAELVILIGSEIPMNGQCSDWQAIGAVGLGLDLTHRERQNHLKSKGLPWTLAKSFAGAAIVTPLIPRDALAGQTQFNFRFFLDGQLRQQGDTAQMIFSVPQILSFLARFNNLYPGDLIFTGTPAGVGPISRGQKFSLELSQPHRVWQGSFD